MLAEMHHTGMLALHGYTVIVYTVYYTTTYCILHDYTVIVYNATPIRCQD